MKKTCKHVKHVKHVKHAQHVQNVTNATNAKELNNVNKMKRECKQCNECNTCKTCTQYKKCKDCKKCNKNETYNKYKWCHYCLESYKNKAALNRHIGKMHKKQTKPFDPRFDFTNATRLPTWQEIKAYRHRNAHYNAAGFLKMICENMKDPRSYRMTFLLLLIRKKHWKNGSKI